MKYFGNEHDAQNSNTKIGVLLMNLGTPARPVCPSLRDYLSEFLMDPRVIELPKLFRAILVKGIIINVRSHKSAAAYREVWTEQGSPLMLNTVGLTDKVRSMQEKLSALHKNGVRNIIAIPLYPQYSGSTNGSTFDAIGKAFSKQRWVPNLKFVSDYYQRKSYIMAIGDSIKTHWAEHGRNQKLILSFHGVPKKYITSGDPYYSQCKESAQDIADYLQLNDDDWMLVFQSRLGAQEWLQPYCDKTLQELPQQGVKSVDIICPGFRADCKKLKAKTKSIFLKPAAKTILIFRA